MKTTRQHENTLSKREMETLAALCDTLLPSAGVTSSGNDSTNYEDLAAFYETSPSMTGTPDHMGGLISGGIYHPALGIFRPTLWLLSTWYGTFLICGLASLSVRFPFFQKFSQVGQDKREEIMLSWSLSSFYLFKMLFKCVKYVTMLVFFTQVNAHNGNPSWRALGYCGPHPSASLDSSQQVNTAKEEEEGEKNCSCPGPLHEALLHVDRNDADITRQLSRFGFPTPVPPSLTSSLLTLRCDAVVVGSGSGGSVVAGVLASAGYKVLVLEKGGYYARQSLTLLEGPTSRAMYEGGGITATDDLGVLLLAGSTVGGGSTINWSACLRTPDHVRREWCHEHGLELFASKAFDRALDAVCDRMEVQSKVDREGFNSEILRKGCAESGYPVTDVPCNAPSDHYCGWCHFGCKDGKKKSTQETWLADVASSRNGLILPQCRAVKVVHKRRRSGRKVAHGVVAETTHSKQKFIVESKVTIVACGALNTPGLLKRSGLRNKNIGEHLHLHPVAMAWGYFPESKWPEGSKRSYEGGILTAMSTAVANFDTSGYGAILQTPALHPGMFSALTPWVSPADFRERMTRFSRTAHIFALARDKGSGSVDYPKTVRYRLERDDEENLTKGVEVALRVLVAAGAEEVGTHYCGGERIRVGGTEGGDDDDELERLVGEVRRRGLKELGTPMASAHQMGSCRMGVKAKMGAVGPEGETWEVEGLFVADSSVFPTALGVNPMVTVQAIAYCTAQSILQLLRRRKL